MTTRQLRAALYARVSTNDQTTDNQLLELRRCVEARGWTATEYVDQGVSGVKESRPSLDALLKDARRRRVDVVVCWSLDRIGRSLKHVVVLLDDLQALGASFVSVREGLDWTTPSGRLQAQLLSMIAEFERARIRERVVAGVARAKAQGRRLGRPERDNHRIPVTVELGDNSPGFFRGIHEGQISICRFSPGRVTTATPPPSAVVLPRTSAPLTSQ